MLSINKLVKKRQTDEHSRCGWSCRSIAGTCKWTHGRNPHGGDRARPGGVHLPLKALPIYKKKQISSSFSLPAESKAWPDRSTAVGQGLAAELCPELSRRAGSNDLVIATSSCFVGKPKKLNKIGLQGECMNWNG